MLPRTLLYCTENVAGIHACIRGRGQGSLDPPENRRNIVFPCNAGPVKNHKVVMLGHHRFASKFNGVTLKVSPIKKVKVGPHAPPPPPPPTKSIEA